MMYIAHRGNINGPIPEKENRPDYILEAIAAGYMAEVDVWWVSNHFFLGHDNPQYQVDESWIVAHASHCIYHCKNLGALNYFALATPISNKFHYFWHDKDDYTMTSFGYIWAYPNKPLGYNIKFIACQPGYVDWPTAWDGIAGICGDYVSALKFKREKI